MRGRSMPGGRISCIDAALNAVRTPESHHRWGSKDSTVSAVRRNVMSHFAYAMGARIISRSPRLPTDEHQRERDRERDGVLVLSARRVRVRTAAWWRRLWRTLRRRSKAAQVDSDPRRPLTAGTPTTVRSS